MKRLGAEFYQAPTLELAERLLGKIFVRCEDTGMVTKARIVETEAYLGEGDEACHAWRGMTNRNRAMFGPPGHLYIYFTYGCHYMINIVSEQEGTAGAVLLRAMEPLEGIDRMQERRGTADERALMSGPGKLAQALGIGPELYGSSLLGESCWLEDAPEIPEELIGTSPRIGITRSTELPWRKFVTASPHVSTTRLGAPKKKRQKRLERR
ncbi:DNA-3-methyladenine glycosylase [Chlorobaculum parvum NCIB 8327]|uniref:Putative 3-methyladenine DNA glycosylase n=1 Tax=Chlorobaculum parvum (strain DSM 263 / NCIMB 8327) TaxID=517417 RepID=3MGH_CHLP8|nr:DNA-3-methyladenine glycosylase [Chlorobaculum parvum]B3QKY6.1 RecName: Full=Putative 3-methyladenine DNA glycosylase [Chlorobaculum parvum NCIB 8327]ACF10774.1 DNA-3-methyladenine glycosylase [Chlorobaculum parvum NCIB 8327]